LTTFLFPGRAGVLGAAAVKVALAADVSGNAALLFGRMCSYNGQPFWELRRNLKTLFNCSTRTITRYFAALVDAGLIVNKPAPLGVVPPGCKTKLPYRPWYKWAIGMPKLREAVKSGSREAYHSWIERFEVERKGRVTRSKLATIIGTIVHAKAPDAARPREYSTARPRRWTAHEIDRELTHNDLSIVASSEPKPDTS
jgi:hypothetical protein